MKLPRDLSGIGLAKALRVYGYAIKRQTGSHLRLTSSFKGTEHHITVPAHKQLRVGILAAILGEVAQYLEIDREVLSERIFRG